MAGNEMEITFKWENDNYFSFETKKNADPKITDIRIEENTHIKGVWPTIQKACIIRLTQILSDIGKEMEE
ncbi:hypothetical protein LCGC14_0527150 [marine sediment metagenome]|uniref:Activator of Hsp90 ATPase N-terminal domain-containing protein n=1 Tax=marine sediment metagenome TaxID=412755 RepID=A0A0F9UI52_9ZZZZ